MNIISYNIRGLGRGIKWPAIRRLVNENHIDLLCIQETKMENINKSLCHALWGNSEFSWESYPAANSAGGILCVWNEKSLKVESRFVGAGFILLSGKWGQESQTIHVVNIYSPCNIQEKRVLWDNVSQLKNQIPGGYWCILGDFNSVRSPVERIGSSQRGSVDGSIAEFNNWIEELEVEEAPWVGKRFTWFRPNDSAKSRLDRFLVSPEWLAKWPGSVQSALVRNFSDHCPVLLRSKNVDWGPKPFRILDCWLSDKSFKKVVIDSWSANPQSGWGGYAIKEKIKALKQKIKIWNKEHYGDIFSKFKKIEGELNLLEETTADRQLDDNERALGKQLQQQLWETAQSHESLLRQKARSRWIKEGDCNSRYFHLLINSRRRSNGLNGVLVDGVWKDEPAAVKEEVKRFFSRRFQEADYDRPKLDGIIFKTITSQQNDLLTERFQEEEMKRAVWSCGSDKSPGPDGLNLKFIKQF